MTKIERFEDLESWKNARLFVKEIYALTSNKLIKNDFSFQDQIRRASISIMNNIAEGFGRYNNKEFKRFLGFSAASSLEVRSMLYLAKDLEYVSQEVFEEMIEKHNKLHSQILAFIKYLNANIKTYKPK